MQANISSAATRRATGLSSHAECSTSGRVLHAPVRRRVHSRALGGSFDPVSLASTISTTVAIAGAAYIVLSQPEAQSEHEDAQLAPGATGVVWSHACASAGATVTLGAAHARGQGTWHAGAAEVEAVLSVYSVPSKLTQDPIKGQGKPGNAAGGLRARAC
eukprot:CAMPEP_0202862450 /NCGR_PEP_ID=MMETSP1391-20130828/3485_1 /ASSEMBLY_ACC=CAM_ASM_000867 /TAXON_ID=1034604 /ORGANISM="Chlamydomonas leiostraca, Strain SAG 11-49" /LENGTH=159 /DNA_ID=CAMNT_0049541991 /DNA_START=147 /DNA_END=627 /DNA_ORIENTATION=+